MLLSIGMMVKNEEKHLDECLSSLQPVLKNLNSELIIVDTGSTDRTIEIAKKYTKKLYFHEWNNNFSEMRNIVLEYCTGEWFFCIDGDEVLENCDSIIEFFNSNTYKKFNTATIQFKDLNNSTNLKEFGLVISPRLFKKDCDFKYTGSVHNQPQFKYPVASLNTIGVHYGYVRDDTELMKRKFERTATLLKKELKKDPNNVYYLYQLSVSYSMNDDHMESYNFLKKAYNLIKNLPNSLDYLNIYQSLCIECFELNNFIDTEKYASKALEIKEDFMDFYYFIGIAQMKLNKISEAINNFNIYLNLHKGFNNSKNNLMLQYYTVDYLDRVYYCLSELHIKNNDYNNAISNLIKIDENKYTLQSMHIALIKSIILSKNYPLLTEYQDKLLNINKNAQLNDFILALENFKLESNSEDFSEIELIFSKGTTNYNILNQLRINFKTNSFFELNNLKNIINNIDFSKENYYFGDIIYYFLINKYDMAKLLAKCSPDKLSIFFQFIFQKYQNTSTLLYDYINNVLTKDKFIYIRLKKELLHYLIILDDLDISKLNIVYNLYLEYGFKYLHFVYTDYIINMDFTGDVKNDEEAFLLLLNKAFRYKDNNARLYIKKLKEALDIFKPMRKIINFLLSEFSDK